MMFFLNILSFMLGIVIGAGVMWIWGRPSVTPVLKPTLASPRPPQTTPFAPTTLPEPTEVSEVTPFISEEVVAPAPVEIALSENDSLPEAEPLLEAEHLPETDSLAEVGVVPEPITALSTDVAELALVAVVPAPHELLVVPNPAPETDEVTAQDDAPSYR